MRKKSAETLKILEAAIEGIRRIKGKELLMIDLTTIHHSECSYFLICHGTSNTQVEALAHSVEDTVHELTGEKTWHKDGYRNAIWILLDFGDIMVHVFKEEARTFYNLEGLWSDAKISQLEEDN